MQWETVIGLEVHAQLSTKSKIFSPAATEYGAEPNTQACNIDLAMPGVLPVLNKAVVEMAVKFGLAANAKIAEYSEFSRKNYFYPDLPKGYQISQFELPIVGPGFLDVELKDGSVKRIGITRAHLEEDAGKSLHGAMPHSSGIDLNRAGTPLLEIVSEPDMRSAEEAIAYLKTLHNLVRYLGICDGNMQEGSFRCDVNVSLRPVGQKEFGTRTETKNLNSFRFIERAIFGEVERQKEILENGGKITQETRLYDSDLDESRSMRSKEEANDYRYFPDPDLLPLEISTNVIEKIKQEMPELPWEKRKRFQEQYGLSAYDATILANDLHIGAYFEKLLDDNISPKLAANWINGDLAAFLNKHNLTINASPITPDALRALLIRIADQTISSSAAKTVFEAMWNQEGTADEIIEIKGLKQITDSSAIEKIVDEVIAANPAQVADYRAGKDKLIAFFVGQVMKASKGKANPDQVNQLLKEKLKN